MHTSEMNPHAFRDKYPPEIRDWWENVLKSPKYIVAPMVDASELAWRMLSRRYNSDLCFTPMFHSRLFVEEAKYRNDNFLSALIPEDRPLIVQFCGNDPDVMVKAAEIVKPYCDGVDINLGCPQKIASAGHYGAFLMDEWDLISSMVSRIKNEVKVPVSCKIRIFSDVKKTISYAKMIEKAGAYMITVHGRTREQKGVDTGLADWKYIKAVRENVNVPVVANGNIQYLNDVFNCIETTGVEGVMSAEGNLHNPKLFVGENPPVWEVGEEYLQLVKLYPCPLGYSRGHLFKLYHHLLTLNENSDMRQALAVANNLDDLISVTHCLKERYIAYHLGNRTWEWAQDSDQLPFPNYICQPYVRPPKRIVNPEDKASEQRKRKIVLPDHILATIPKEVTLSNNKIKKMSKKPNKNWALDFQEKQPFVLCHVCSNPKGAKCLYFLCRKCCKSKCDNETLDCEGHKIFMKRHRDTTETLNL